MDENASRAVFIGVSTFVAVITLTFIVRFYATAKESASVANRYDVSVGANTYLNEVLNKKSITGLELRYLMNYYSDNKDVTVLIYLPGETANDVKIITNLKQQDTEEYWSDDYQAMLVENIRPNYSFTLVIDNSKGMKIIAMYEN